MDEKDDKLIDRAEYNSQTDTYHASYSPDDPYSLTFTIINLIEVATGKEHDTMEPLFEVVDPDALENLFPPRNEQTARVEFRYRGCKVTILSDGEVSVTATTDR